MKLNKKNIIILASLVVLVAMITVFLSVKALWPRALKRAVFDCATCCDKGDVKCDTCDGKVSYKCTDPRCFGNGDRLCTECKGKGTYTCVQCHGTGTISDGGADSQKYICAPCMGQGQIECPTSVPCECDENGKIHCTLCSDGRVDCPDC